VASKGELNIEEAEKSLSLMYAMLVRMQLVEVDGEQGIEILQTAHKCNLTFYDSTYLVEAKKSKILVTDDNNLAKAAEILGIETLSSNTLIASQKHKA
jgi:predicted nucleic acid-binding protein